MGKTIRIDLENLRFYSYHGFYPEEQLLGNEYSLSIKTSFTDHYLNNDELENTVNYEQLYAIARNSMGKPRKLLETVAHEMLDSIKEQFPKLNNIEVSICKLNPLFGGDKAQARVSLIWYNKD